MFQIIESIMGHRQMINQVIATAPTFEAAIDTVCEMGVLFLEEDADYPNCADALMADGRVIAIQPEGFTLEGKDHEET